MPLRLGLPLRERLLDEDVYGVAVLGVNHHERSGLCGDLHRPEERLVVHHDRALVRHEELVARHPLVRRLLEVFECPAFLEVGDRQVEAYVDHRLGAFDLLVPRRQRIREALARLLEAEVDVARRAAEGGRGSPRGEVVAGDRPAERHLHVGVRVDRARDDVLAARVDDLVSLHVERLPDEGDPLVLDEYVPHVIVGGGDDTAALDQYRHSLLAPLSTNNTEFTPLLRYASLPVGGKRPYRVEHDLGSQGRVRRLRVLLRRVADAVLARDEDHRARHAVGDAHRVVGRARVHRHVRLAARLRRLLQRSHYALVQRRCREGLALGVLGPHAAFLGGFFREGGDVARDAAEALLVHTADVEREAGLAGNGVYEVGAQLDLSDRPDRPFPGFFREPLQLEQALGHDDTGVLTQVHRGRPGVVAAPVDGNVSVDVARYGVDHA